ncbi:MAG: ABC transporter substrate-binding protein, partial [Parachlamydia sp.]|nr:ABC transporter substrate-binding protein [Parachlamydia sp.]
MTKEPIGLYIFRFVLALGLFAFMAMLYWSSLLLEEDVKAVRSDMQQIKEELSTLRSDVAHPVMNAASAQESKKQIVDRREHIDATLPNLLTPDPFFEKTLPTMLGPDFKPHGTFHHATLGRPDNLHPFSNWAEVSNWIGLCIAGVAKQEFGKYETLSPDLALKMEERPSSVQGVPEFWVHLREGLFWQPLQKDFFSENVNLSDFFLKKHPVTAEDFKFWFDALMNPHNQTPGAVAQRNYFGDIEEIRVLDPLTFVVRWKAKEVEIEGKKEKRIRYIARLLTGGVRPLASFVYKYFPDGKKILEDDNAPDTYRTSSVWAQNFAQHWAKNIIPSCGPWMFEGMTERQVSFRRNPDFYLPLAALADAMEVTIKDSADSIWQDFQGNALDTYSLQPDKKLEWEQFQKSANYQSQKAQDQAIEQLDYLDRRYTYIGWNEAKPFFKEASVRRALTMAIDRNRIIREALHGMGIEVTGPFFHDSPSYDSTVAPLPYDAQKARQNLEEAGWYDSNGDGVIDKVIDGKRISFEFTLTYYVKNTTAKVVAEMVATALKKVGILCNPNGV